MELRLLLHQLPEAVGHGAVETVGKGLILPDVAARRCEAPVLNRQVPLRAALDHLRAQLQHEPHGDIVLELLDLGKILTSQCSSSDITRALSKSL